jgi:Icc-related predicted phosphoesterase
MSKVLCISDLHGYLPEISECDLLLIAGDICPVYNHKVAFQKSWLNHDFRNWLQKVPAKKIVGIAGNHDYVFEKSNLSDLALPWTYLNKQSTEYEGIKIWGSPYQLWFLDWAFNAPEENGEKYLAKIYDKIPVGTDIIISHGPPYGFGDLTDRGESVGSQALLDKIKEIKPKYVITGHIHSARGIYEIDHGQQVTTVINAAILDEKYQPVNEGIFEINL